MKESNRLFGLNLARLREMKGKSQDDLAEALDATNVTISRWENGKMGASQESIDRICRYFGVDEIELFRPVGDTSNESYSMKDLLDPEKVAMAIAKELKLKHSELNQSESELVNAFRSLDEADRLRLIEIAKGFKRTNQIERPPEPRNIRPKVTREPKGLKKQTL